jgi:predicted O-linked N-acetylglucosamine transferase (SPINDLY family)/predicted SAM-dependent methyltransferase
MRDSVLLSAIQLADELRESGQLEAAMSAYQAVVADYPEVPDGHFKLGSLFTRLEQLNKAESCYVKALSIWPQYPEANNNLGLIYMQRGDVDAAEFCFRTALAERPDFLNANLNLSGLLHDGSRLLEAEYFAKRAITLSPDVTEGYARLGQAARSLGRINESITHFQRAAEIDPRYAQAKVELGHCYWQLGRHQDAMNELQSAIDLAPDSFAAWSNFLLASNYTQGSREQAFARHTAFGTMIRKKCGDKPVHKHVGRQKADRRLRIGFLSSDFRRNSVAYFVKGALGHLNRAQFQLFAYYNYRSEDSVTGELKPKFHFWRSVFGLPDQEVAELIAADHIDILIDLNGLLGAARPFVLGRKPAPIQVHWLGYPNTTGLDCIDYRITDLLADPLTEDGEFYSEALWRLPQSFLCYSPPTGTPSIVPPPCLEQAEITFGSFNSRAKLSEECVSLWVKVLDAVPGSRLVLKSLYGTDDDAARDSLVQLFVVKGIDANRIEVLLRRSEVDDHLAAYSEIDIALDTFPYHGTTTTCEALWMGVPVVTLAGDRHASRVGVSILTNIELDAFVAENDDEYIEIAVALAQNRQALSGLRQTMRDRMMSSPLMDRRGMGLALGTALREMWHKHCDKLNAELSDSVEGEPDVALGSPELIRLHIGGQVARDGWKVFDSDARPEVDFVGSIQDLTSFAAESCSDIYCSHVLEHVGVREILGTLNGFYRVLAPGGRLFVSVPDLDVLVWLFSSPDFSKAEKFRVMRMMFGAQVDDYDFHRIGLNFDFLSDYLRDVGFLKIEHVESFGLFDDMSETRMHGHLISINLIATK